MKQLFFTLAFFVFLSKAGFTQQSSNLVYMTGEVVSISKDNLLTCTNVAGDIPGTNDSLKISKLIDISTVFPGMKGEMTIGVANGFLKSKTGKTVVIKITEYTSKVDDEHIIKVGNKLKIGWSSPERSLLYSKYDEATKEYNKGNYEKAIEMYNSALSIDSNHVPSLIKIAKSYKANDNYFESFKYYGKAIKTEPDNYQARIDRFLVCYKLSRPWSMVMDNKKEAYAITGLEDISKLLDGVKNKKLELKDSDVKALYKYRVALKISANKQYDCCEDISKILSLNSSGQNADEENAEFINLKGMYCGRTNLSKKATRYREVLLNSQSKNYDTLKVSFADTMKACVLQLSKTAALKTGDTLVIGTCEKTNMVGVARVISVENAKEFSVRIIRWNMTEKELAKIPGMSSVMVFNSNAICAIRYFEISPNSKFYVFW
jgi:tetratricopeptide (TPR) repeat protein